MCFLLFSSLNTRQNGIPSKAKFETSAKEGTTAIRKSTPWLPPGSSPGSAGIQSAVQALCCLFAMVTVQEGLLNGEVEQVRARARACSWGCGGRSLCSGTSGPPSASPGSTGWLHGLGRTCGTPYTYSFPPGDPPEVAELACVAKPFAADLRAVLAVPGPAL